MVLFLRGHGHTVNRKRVQRLMRGMGLAGMEPGPNHQSSPHPSGAQNLPVPAAWCGHHATQSGVEHRHHPGLRRGRLYIRLTHGFAYLVAIIDWYSRRVLSWRISNRMEQSFCVECLQDAMTAYGKPEVFNSD